MAKAKPAAPATTGARVIYDGQAGPNGLRKPFTTFVDEEVEVKDAITGEPRITLRRRHVNPGDVLPLGDTDVDQPAEDQPSNRARLIKGHIERGVCRVVTD